MRRSGFTLIEMLVVLAILGAVTTVALRSVSTVQDRVRYEKTQRAFAEAERALLGDGAGDPGFAGDMGRLPLPPDPSLPEAYYELTDLLANPSLALNEVAVAAEDDQVTLASGWRGPYLQVPAGAQRILDGYDRPLLLRRVKGAVGQPARWWLHSTGPDGLLAPGGAATDDVEVPLYDAVLPTPSAEAVNLVYATDLSGEVEIAGSVPAGFECDVVLWSAAADGSLTSTILQQSAGSVTPTTAASEQYAFHFAGQMVVGPRVLRAYLHAPGAPLDGPPPQTLPSQIVRLTLRPGGNHPPENLRIVP